MDGPWVAHEAFPPVSPPLFPAPHGRYRATDQTRLRSSQTRIAYRLLTVRLRLSAGFPRRTAPFTLAVYLPVLSLPLYRLKPLCLDQ